MAARFTEGVVKALEELSKWAEKILKRIVEYGKRFVKAFMEAGISIFKLILFYVPALVMLYLSVHWGSVWLFIFSVGYSVLITAVGMTYGNRMKDAVPAEPDVDPDADFRYSNRNRSD